MKTNQSDILIGLIKQKIREGKLPVGYSFVNLAKKKKIYMKQAKSNFYQTDYYLVGAFYKPISFIMDK